MKVGVLLAGCGMYDGTEVVEAVLALQCLDRAGASAVCLAPLADQMHTVDHLTGEEVEAERRSVLAESARIARGKVRSLAETWTGDLQGLIVPGGYGVPKNLMSGFMQPGVTRRIVPEVKSLLDDLTARRRPIGAVSLGRTLLKAYFGEDLGEEDLSIPATEVVVDADRRLLFTPGFLSAARLTEVAQGIETMVGSLLRIAAEGLPVLRRRGET